MKIKIMVIVCSGLLTMPVLSFAQVTNELKPNVSAYERANQKARFKRGTQVYNSKANKDKRARKLAKKKAAAEKKKTAIAQEKGEGQVHVKF